MLELRPNCENCNTPLPPGSEEARICGFECTFCATCVETIMHNVCPNCGGGFERRPVRPKAELVKYPASDRIVLKPIDMESFQEILEKNRDIKPSER